MIQACCVMVFLTTSLFKLGIIFKANSDYGKETNLIKQIINFGNGFG